MFFPRHTKSSLVSESGFTLIELLVVVLLLAIIAGASINGYSGVQEQGRYDLSQFEMAEIRKALLQFRRDSGSRDFPKQGQYDCANALNFPSTIASLTASQKLDWCNSPANFWMLFENPLDDPSTTTFVEGSWNIDTGRGWNGPYLQHKQALISYLSIDSIPSVLSPYETPYLMIDLTTDDASIISMGENDTFGVINDCGSDDADDSVVCLLK